MTYIDIAKVVIKIRKYCAYQERSQQEVRDKLYELGLHKKDVEETISQLIGDGFINEERFAIAYAGGKFRIKKWGRVKIKLALQQKKVSLYCIRKALSQINDSDYLKTISENINSYAQRITEENQMKRNYKIAQHVISKGFEPELVWEILREETAG